MHRPYDDQVVRDIFTHLGAIRKRGPIVWEVRIADGQVHYLLGTPSWSALRVKEAFVSHASVQFSESVVRNEVKKALKLRISSPALSLNTEVLMAMVRASLSAMIGGLKAEPVIQIVLGASFAPGATPKNLPDPSTSWVSRVIGNVHDATAEQRKAVREKAEQYSFDAIIRIGANSEPVLTKLVSAFRTLESAGVHIRTANEKPERLNQCLLPWVMPLKLSVRELCCFSLLPAGDHDYPGTGGLHPKLLLPPSWYRGAGKNDRFFATSMERPGRRLSIPAHDALEHTVLLGPTGSGKSTVMEHLILADIEAGRSVLVIDPKADLITDILERIPDKRKDDVVVIDPSDPSPVGFNPLAYSKNPSLTTDSILAVLQELFSQNWGIRSADILAGAILTLCRVKGATLLWLPYLLTDENFRKKITSGLDDPIALSPFWEHYETLRDSERRTEIAPVLNKLRQISYRPYLRNVLGQSAPRFSLSDLFFKRKIVLVPLNKGLIGAESARLLGSLNVGLTWTLALSRSEIPQEKRHMVSVYVDELQDYLALPTSFSDALAQARGLGVAYTVAHQYRGQLPQDIRAGIDANCRNKIIFGLTGEDAKAMSQQAPELEPLDFMTLPRYQIYTYFHSGGKSTGWISGVTHPPSPALRTAAELKAESMKRYGVPATQTEKELIDIIKPSVPEHDPSIASKPIGRKKKHNGEKP